jgi:uncharacterized membrane protein YfcA
MDEYFLLAAIMLVTGLCSGLLAGLLGIGGGIVIVPVLEAALATQGVDPAIRMHVAVATSLATIIPTSISSARAHYRRQSVDVDLLRRWAVFILLGAVIGATVAVRVESSVLATVFGCFAFLVGLKMLLPLEGKTIRDSVPRGPLGAAIPVGIGGVATMMGIGGGGLAVPVLTLCGEKIHRAVGTAALFGLLVSLPGTLGYILGGLGDPRLPPGSLGYVNLVGFILIVPATVVAAPIGARIAHSLSRRRLGVVFGCFLLLISARMIYRAVAG